MGIKVVFSGRTRAWVIGLAIATLAGALLTSSSASAGGLYPEQQGSRGVNTFTNYHNASGVGPAIPAGSWVNVSCKVYDPYIASVNPDGYWYRIASSPWNDAYYSPANTFMNGDPWGGPFTHNTDFNVPDCASSPPPSPVVQLAQGPVAPYGYRYAVTLTGFSPGSGVSVTCYDSVSPGGFYTFTMTTDGAGSAYTASQCYSADGPDHWVTANGIGSNYVQWGTGTSGGGGGIPPSTLPSYPPPTPPASPPGGGGSPSVVRWAALGDSYSAGEGVPPFSSRNDCHRSKDAYTEVLAGTSGFPVRSMTDFWACSGAKIGNFYNGQNGEPSQISRLNATTALVTLTAGGNDVEFAKTLGACTFVRHCQLVERPITDRLIDHTAGRLYDLYKAILRAAPNARVFVLGYPRFISENPSLACQPLIGTDEAQWMASAVEKLNSVIESKIRDLRDGRVHYVNTTNLFQDGEACSVTGKFVNSYVPRHPEYSFHPTAAGQVLMASKLAHAVRR